MPELNTIQWPSIDAFPKSVCYTIQQYLSQCDIAASVLQTWVRHSQRQTDESESAMKDAMAKFRFETPSGRRLYALTINDYFCNRPIVASEKYDGTNVGKDEECAIYGRRQMISSESYQKTPLTEVRKVDTAKMKEDLFAEIGADATEKDAFTMVAYGELMCNKGLFDYQDRALSSGWFIFGIILRHKKQAELKMSIFDEDDESEEARAAAAQTAEVAAAVDALGDKLAAAKYVCSASCVGPEAVMQVKIGMCDNLRRLVECSGGGITPQVCENEREGSAMSICEVVTAKQQWMMACSGEGVVVTLPVSITGAKACTLRKWKSAVEPQGTNCDVLRKALEEMAPLQGVACLHRDVFGMVQVLCY
jgi:hypothetical protein